MTLTTNSLQYFGNPNKINELQGESTELICNVRRALVEGHILDQFYTYGSISTREIVTRDEILSDQLIILRMLFNDLFKDKIVELSIQHHRIIGLGVFAFVNMPREGKEFPAVMNKLREEVRNYEIMDISTFVLPIYVV